MRLRFPLLLLASVLAAWAMHALAPQETIRGTVGAFLGQRGIAGAVVAFGRVGEEPTILEIGQVSAETPLPIASLSKPITAAAILLLVEQGRLSLDTRLAALVPEVAAAPDVRHREITLRHLLQHTAGWDWDRSGDPVFDGRSERPGLESGCRAAMAVMLDAPLDHPPGERHAYSNLGYCWLGRVVELVSGQGYEDFVRQAVLAPAGAGGMRLGAPAILQRVWSAGGWVGTARAYFGVLARPVPAGTLEGPVPAGDILYGLGWRVLPRAEGLILYHNGHLFSPGGTALAFAIRAPDGTAAVALFSSGMPVNDRAAVQRLAETVLRLARP